MTDNTPLDGLTLGGKDIAALFGVTVQAIGMWVRGGMPKAAKDCYDVKACVQWRQAQLLESRSGGNETLDEERRLLIVEQRRGHELQNAQTAGELLSAEEVQTDMLAFAAILAGQLDAFPQRVAGRVAAVTDPDIVRKVLRDECRSVRRAASQAFAAYGDSLGNGEDSGPAPGAKRRAVGRRVPRAAAGESGAGALAY